MARFLYELMATQIVDLEARGREQFVWISEELAKAASLSSALVIIPNHNKETENYIWLFDSLTLSVSIYVVSPFSLRF